MLSFFREKPFSSVIPSNPLVLVSDPWRVSWADVEPCHLCCLCNYRDRSQDTIRNNWTKPWLCFGWKRTRFHWSKNWGEVLAAPWLPFLYPPTTSRFWVRYLATSTLTTGAITSSTIVVSKWTGPWLVKTKRINPQIIPDAKECESDSRRPISCRDFCPSHRNLQVVNKRADISYLYHCLNVWSWILDT